MRSLKADRPFVLMEQASAAVNWRPVNMPKRPGLMRLHSLQAVARGSDGVLFFQWRASRSGAEKFHSGMIQHVPPADSRVFAEVKALGAELKNLRPVAGSVVRNRVAIAFDWHAWWAVELESKPGRIDYAAWAQRMHAWCYDHNLGVDFVHPSAALGGYDLVIAPALYLLKEDDAGNLERFVAEGGTLLATYFSGIVDENDHAVCGGYPAYLRKVLGMWVEDWVPYPEGRSNRAQFGRAGAAHRCDHWCEVVHLERAKALANFKDDFFAGKPAVTRYRFGKGHAYYLATQLEASGMDVLMRHVANTAKLQPPLVAPKGVEVSVREGSDARFMFLLNHTDRQVRISLGRIRGRDLLSGRQIGGSVTLAPLDVKVTIIDRKVRM
jgi:beta-galactosidase